MMPSKNFGLSDQLLPECYESEALIAASDRSTVYLARNRNTQQRVAIKQFTAQASRLFMHETNLAVVLSHPALLSCEGSFYNEQAAGSLVFEFMSGGTLRERLRRYGKMSISEALDCVVQILNGLIELHKQGWVHGDLKPENIYLRQADGDGVSYVIGDLGSCRAMKDLALGHTAVGTPAYSAPETLFKKQDVRSDLYSLGIMAYEMVTGVLPMAGSIQDARKTHLQSALPLERVDDGLFRDLIGALAARQPEDRFTDALTALSIMQSMGFTDWQQCRPDFPDHPTVHQLDIAGFSSGQMHELVLNQKPDAIHILGDGDQNYCAAFVSRGLVELPTLPEQGEYKTLVAQGVVAKMSDGQIGYHSAGRLVAYNPFTLRRRDILPVPHNILGMVFSDTHVAWFDGNGYYLYEQHAKQHHVHRVKKPQSASKASIALYQGGFVRTEGTWNREIVFHDQYAQPYDQMTLPDPVMTLASAENSVWAITLRTDGCNSYQVWSLTPNSHPRVISLFAPLNSWSICGCHLDLLLRDNSIWRLSDLGLVKLTSSALNNPVMVAVSADGTFVVVAQTKPATTILEFHHLLPSGAKS